MRVRKVILLILIIFSFPLPAFPQNLDEELSFAEEDGITVTGTLQTSQQIFVIEKEEIENLNAPDLAVLLQESNNLNITRYGAYGSSALVNLRGLDSKRLAFLIDGVPVNSSMDGRFDIDQIDINSVERIEVIHGGSDTRYNVSGAMGGVINIITVKKQKPGLKLNASVSNMSAMPGEYRDRGGGTQGPNWEDLLDTQNISLSAAYGGGNFSFTTSAFANRAENHFLFTDRYGYTRRKDNNEVWDAGGAASFVLDLPDSAKMIASSSFYYGDKNIPVSGFSDNSGRQNDISSRNNLMLEIPRAFRDDLACEASVGWHFIRRDYASPAEIFSRHDQQNITAINRWNWYPGVKLVLRSGFDYRFIYLDSSDVGNRNRHDGGIYLTAEFKPARQFMIIPSVKAVFTSEGDTPVTAVPKLGFLWNVTNLRFADSLAIKNNYFRSFKFPDFEDLYWTGSGSAEGNPYLRPEDGWGADLGVSWRVKNLIDLNSTFFTNWLKDSIHWSPGTGGIWRPENIGEAMFFGIENKIQFDIPVSKGPIKKITPSVSYQYLLSYLLSFGYDFSSDKRIPYSPEHTIGGSISFAWETGSFLISGHYESRRFQDRSNLVKLDPHFLLNAHISQKTGRYFSFFTVLRNILNASYESFYDYPMPGFTLTIGMRMNLEAR